MSIIIAPSILSADFARLGEEVNAVLAAGADWIHFDVMDNHYVPNLTIGPLVCEALRHAGVEAPIDVHLMVTPVDPLVSDFAKAGATIISFHPEATAARRSHHRTHPRLGLQTGSGFQSGDLAQLVGLRDRQDRRDPADVGQPGIRRTEIHSPGSARNSPRRGRESRRAAATFGWRSTAGSRWRMRPKSPGRVPIPSSPGRRSSAVPTTRPPSQAMRAQIEIGRKAAGLEPV